MSADGDVPLHLGLRVGTPVPRPSVADLLAIALWAGAVFGLLEGLALCVTRWFPLIEAAHKVSNDALWIAPLVDTPLFLLVAAMLVAPLRLWSQWGGPFHGLAPFAAFVLMGTYSVLTVPRVLHQASALTLALGITVVVCRRLSGREAHATATLRRRAAFAPLLILAAWGGLTAAAAAREQWILWRLPPPARGSPNVLVITLDTVRADRFRRPATARLTPHLDRLAERGVRFENAWSTSSWSLPSQASMLTGRYPHDHGADWPAVVLAGWYPTLGEYLQGRGYSTGAFSGNSSWVTPEYLGRGFLRFEAYTFRTIVARTVFGRKINQQLLDRFLPPLADAQSAADVSADFLDFVGDTEGRPFFAYLCFMDVNEMFFATRLQPMQNRDRRVAGRGPALMKAAMASYDRALALLDASLARLFAEIRRRNLETNTMVFVTSDHGQSFGRPLQDHDPIGHGTSLYREQTEIPLMLWFPGRVPPGALLRHAVGSHQIPATVAHLLGARDSPFPQASLLSGVNAEEPAGKSGGDTDPCVLSELRRPRSERQIDSVVCGRFHYIETLPKRNGKPREELFDLTSDPIEQRNLAGDPRAQPLLARLRRELQRRRPLPRRRRPAASYLM